ncbi:phage tail assembly chaperone [Erythrobacter colymbi]|uniref:phage tail assembly chaperone n=1 Tax=Erythrobacter colymbi TaxID=1161202 RepID=UPI001F0AC80A|nr:phage tail assembly chaperone [Erythrobacter colymbi]
MMKIYFDTDPATGALRFHHEAILGPRQIPTWKSEAERAAGKRPVMIDNPDCRIPAGATEITAERFAELMAAQQDGAALVVSGGKPIAIPTVASAFERRAARRRRRDQLLAASDWTQLPDSPLSESEKADWAEYRAALRDLDMYGDDWPLAPDGEEEE